LNSLGDAESRTAHREALVAHFRPHIGEFCKDCQSRLEKNPLRILDCKVDRDHPLMASAPSLPDYLNEPSKLYFNQVQSFLEDAGIEYEIDPNLVRGLDYYNHTAFEIMSTSKGFGAITTLCGGGRYNGLSEEIGGPNAPGIGFAMSIERLLLALDAEEKSFEDEPSLDVYVVTLGEEAHRKGFQLLQQLRKEGVKADMDFMDRKMKAQMKSADRHEAKLVCIIAEDEVAQGVVQLKNMGDGTQEQVAATAIAGKIKELLK